MYRFTAINNSGGGEVWEEVNLYNLPTDFKTGDRLKIEFGEPVSPAELQTSADWAKGSIVVPSGRSLSMDMDWSSHIVETTIPKDGANASLLTAFPTGATIRPDFISLYSYKCNLATDWNDTTHNYSIMSVRGYYFNGNDCLYTDLIITRSNITDNVHHIWRLKK